MEAEDDDYAYDDEDYGDDDDETCLGCGANIFCDEHDWDCPYAGDDEDEE